MTSHSEAAALAALAAGHPPGSFTARLGRAIDGQIDMVRKLRAGDSNSGWKLVPIEPTPAMKKAASRLNLGPHDPSWSDGYKAMLKAAPKAPAVPETLTDAEIEAILNKWSSVEFTTERVIKELRAGIARTQSAPPAAQQIGGVE
jgi:hypothetical protein